MEIFISHVFKLLI